jgi:antitoxin component YwqK of YwqJK toxin-antitoxin module
MRILLILAFSLLYLPICAQQDTLNRLDPQGRKTGYWIQLDPSGRKSYEGNFREGHPAGLLKRYHPNGKIKAEMTYDPAGLQVDARLFDTDGKLRAYGRYVNQKKEGLWLFLSKNNLPVFRINYRNGLVHGEAWRFNASGEPVEKTHWNSQVLEGEQLVFHDNGKIQVKMNYRGGSMEGPYEIFSVNGNKEIAGQYHENLKSGKWTYFTDTGRPDYTLEYDRGRVLNPGILDARQQELFAKYEQNRRHLIDPQNFINNPDELLIR